MLALIRDGGLMAWGAPEAVLSGDSVTTLYEVGKGRFMIRLGGVRG